MEKYDAKQYRRSLRLRWWLMLAVTFGALACMVWNLVLMFTAEESRYTLLGTIGYMLLTIMQSHAVFLPQGVSLKKCLQDDSVLRRVWNEEHDERRLLICAKAGMPLVPVISMVFYAVGLVLLFVEDTALMGVGAGVLISGVVFMTVSNLQYTRWNKKLSEEETSDES